MEISEGSRSMRPRNIPTPILWDTESTDRVPQTKSDDSVVCYAEFKVESGRPVGEVSDKYDVIMYFPGALSVPVSSSAHHFCFVAWPAHQPNLVHDRLEMLRNLPDDWNGEGSLAISEQVIWKAKELLSFVHVLAPRLPYPFVAPLVDGGLQMEWKAREAELHLIISPLSERVEYLLDFRNDLGNYIESEGVIDKDISLTEAIGRLG